MVFQYVFLIILVVLFSRLRVEKENYSVNYHSCRNEPIMKKIITVQSDVRVKNNMIERSRCEQNIRFSKPNDGIRCIWGSLPARKIDCFQTGRFAICASWGRSKYSVHAFSGHNYILQLRFGDFSTTALDTGNRICKTKSIRRCLWGIQTKAFLRTYLTVNR